MARLVKAILDHDSIRGKVWYLVHWDGYDEVHDSTWESRERLFKDARKLVLQYDADHGVKTGGGTRKKRKKMSK